NDRNLCPERKTALIARELARYGIDVAAISETHLSDSGELCEQLGGYTYYWSGRPVGERAGGGVGFAVRNGLARDLSDLPKGVNDRLMTLRLPVSGNKYVHLISAYAPTLPSPDVDKEVFYQDLRRVLVCVPKHDKIVLLGDFNARVGAEHELWNGVLGKHGIGGCNDNGLRLLSLSMRGALGWTDHRLIRSKMLLQLKTPRRAPHKIPPVLAFSRLIASPELGDELNESFSDAALQTDSLSIDEEWQLFSKHLYGCALKIIGRTAKKHQDWFDSSDKEITTLVEAHRHELNSQTTDARRKRNASQALRSKVRELKDKWWQKKATELQYCADTHQTGRFFEGVQAIFGPRVRKSAPMYTKDKQHRITNKADLLVRWAEHFNYVLNPDAAGANLLYVNSLEQLPVCQSLDDPPSFEEFVKAVKRLKNSRAPGMDQLPAEVYKYGGKDILQGLYELVLRVWASEEIPQGWRDAGRGDVSDCGSYRGISLLASAGKVLAHIVNVRLSELAEKCLPESTTLNNNPQKNNDVFNSKILNSQYIPWRLAQDTVALTLLKLGLTGIDLASTAVRRDVMIV
ncbi:hypothetical protein MSG28_009390, partial [Choristoneura fumiferana]